MRQSPVTTASLVLSLMTLAQVTAQGKEAQANAPTTMAAPGARLAQAVPLVAADFEVPTMIEGPGFKLVPLAPELAKIDLNAYMSSIEHLQKTFSRSTSWPHKGISDADALGDMKSEQARFNSRKSFAYAVLTPDGRRERGCVYVSPSPVKGYDAVVRLWVTKAEYDAGFDAQLYQWATRWMQTAWPFKTVAYPGRSVEWTSWDAKVAASKAAAPVK